MATTTPSQTQDLVITIPQNGGVARVEQPSPTGRGREVFHVAIPTLGRLVAGLESEGMQGAKWIDLLSSHGIALTYKRNTLVMVMSFPARLKTVNHSIPNERTGDPGRARPVPFNLPPTCWILYYAQPADTLSKSFILSTETQVRSITDQTLCQNLPYGNSFDGSAAVCWGNVPTNGLTSQDPIAADNLFFATGFNNHLVRIDRFTTPSGGVFDSLKQWADWQVANPTTPLRVAPGTWQFHTKLNAILGGREEE